MLILDWKEERRPLGWTEQHCPKCGRLETFAGFDRVLVTRAFCFPVGARTVGRLLVCDFCSATLVPPEGKDLALAQEKKASAKAAEPPSRAALEALLRTLDDSARTGDQEIMRGVWAGGLTGALIGTGLGALVSVAEIGLAPGPVEEQFIPVGIMASLVGLVIGGIVEAQRQRRRAIGDVLGGALRKHRLRPMILQAIAERMQPPVPRAIRALGEYQP